jgi:hypothetical protein
MNGWATLLQVPPLPTSQNIIQHSPWEDWLPPQTKLKRIKSKLQSNTDSRGRVEHWTCHGEWGWGKEQSFQAKSRGRATNQLSKQGWWWIPELVSWDWWWYSKLNCPTLLGEEMITQSCSSTAPWLPSGENNSSEHFAQTSSELPQAPAATCPVDRRSQYYSQASHQMRPHQSSHL